MCMKKSRKKPKGYSVVELMVAIAIAGVIASAIGSYLVFHVRAFNETKEISDLQYEAQLVMNLMEKHMLESKGLEMVLNNSHIEVTRTNAKILSPHYLGGFAIKNHDDKIDDTVYYLFRFDDAHHKIEYCRVPTKPTISYFTSDPAISIAGDDKTKWRTLVEYVEAWELTTTESSYIEAKSVQFNIIFKNEESSQTITNNYYFRNKDV